MRSTNEQGGDNNTAGNDESGTESEDVRIIDMAQTEDGHDAYAIDLDNDDEADVAIIDIDDSGDLSDPDVIIARDGSETTYGELTSNDNNIEAGYEPEPVEDVVENTVEGDDNYVSSLENPDVADGMPDYMDDALVDA